MVKTSAEFDREFETATKRGRERMRNQPLAVAVKCSKARGLILDLNNGVRLVLPLSYLPHPLLHTARPGQLSDVEVVAPGTAIQWPSLDEQIGVLELLKDLLGEELSPVMARELARKGGQSKSETKAAAARANGAKGGRPRKRVATADDR